VNQRKPKHICPYFPLQRHDKTRSLGFRHNTASLIHQAKGNSGLKTVHHIKSCQTIEKSKEGKIMKKADIERKPRNPSITESNKALTWFASCPTCFNFLRIPTTDENSLKHYVAVEETKH
jgi:hypothetical protein